MVLVDLPGVYSLNPRSEDEQVTRDVLAGAMPGIPKPDAVLLILDCTNLGRHLVLAAPILSLKLPTLVILNMADDLKSRGGHVDTAELASELGSPVALISASKGQGVEKVFQFMEGTSAGTTSLAPPRVELPVLQDIPRCRQWAHDVGTGAAYRAPAPPIWTRRLDSVFLHPIAGPLIFLMVVAGVFQTIFKGAKPLMDGLQALIQTSGQWIEHVLPPSIFRSLLVDGVWSGVGAVIVFLPQILLLFLFIGILEDSGYLARAALIADRTMAKFGLQGKSFIPLISAYACAVPAIMATRTIENKRDRLATILIAPFMTCSARLPVYTLIIAAFIADRPLLGHFFGMQAGALLGLYVLGFVAAIVTARLLKSSILKSERVPFVLEMPPYRWPTLRSLGLRLIDRSKVFLRRAGTVILLVIVVLWVLENLAGEERPAARHRRQLRRHDRPRRGTRHQAARIQLEDRHRTDQFHRRARSDRRHARHHLRQGRHVGIDRPAPGAAERFDPRRRRRAAGLLRLRHAMHVHHRGGAPRNRRLEVAGHPVRLHDVSRLRVRADHQRSGPLRRLYLTATQASRDRMEVRLLA